MKIAINQVAEEDRKPLFADAKDLNFGRMFTDHMFVMEYNVEKGWHNAQIKPYEDFKISPAACVLHYSQEIFEGMKAYISDDEHVLMFRPEQNAHRMNRSARKLCMPEIPEEDYIQALKELVMLEKRWIPKGKGTALYIRPTMVATESFLGVHPSKEYLFYIILSPVGPYFKTGFNTVSIYLEDTLVRAAVGGVGDIKTGGNYAAQLLGQMRAEEKGFTQVLWMDAKEHKYIEEVGAMNMFFVLGNKLVTPCLTGSILPGITRNSVIQLARHLGYEVEERHISIDEIIAAMAENKVTEMFGSGTAAVIAPVGSLCYKDKNYVVNNDQVGEVTTNIYKHLLDIQYGQQKDEFEWVHDLGKL